MTVMATETETGSASVLICHVALADVERLEECFATFTESGWVIPKWLVDLRNYVQNRSEQ